MHPLNSVAHRQSAQAAYKRDRRIILTALFSVCLLAWLYTVIAAQQMSLESSASVVLLPHSEVTSASQVTLVFLMWVIMMVAMMLPSVSPMLLMYQSTLQRKSPSASILQLTGSFTLGYLLVWCGFSELATTAQVLLGGAALLSENMATRGTHIGGVILIVAGAFQFTPLKQACLRKCRSPLGFLLNEWREGRNGALTMGMRHGLFCLGCCWALMCVLFVVGVMNLTWIALLTAFVILEKIVPAGAMLARLAGALLVIYGLLLVLSQ